MADKDLRRRTAPVFPRTRSSTNDATSRSDYDLENRSLSAAGTDPLAELEPIAKHVTGFCAKDCAVPKGDVMIQFGTGKVDFAAVFATLKAAGFDGPIMVECCKIGATAEETTANARANRTFLETVLARV